MSLFARMWRFWDVNMDINARIAPPRGAYHNWRANESTCHLLNGSLVNDLHMQLFRHFVYVDLIRKA